MIPFAPRRALLAGAALVGLAGIAPDAAAQGRACADLTALARPDLRITRAESVPAGVQPAENRGRAALAGENRAAMPAHCLVQGMIAPRTGVNGVSYGIGFEIRMPEGWNGRMLFQGGGGMDGVLLQAVGAIPVSGADAAPALMRGYAVVSTDWGHQSGDSRDATFALDQQARLDYAFASLPVVNDQARVMMAAHYGRMPERSYFMGCSNGGRQGMLAAQRYPLMFDGIVAGNPGFRLSRAAVAQAWDVQALVRAAPRDDQGRPILAQSLTPGDLRLVADAIVAQCDAADGLADGVVEAPRACRFRLASLRCDGAKTDRCLAPAQVEALERVFGGARDSRGNPVYASWPWDPGIATPGWRIWKIGTAPDGQNNALNWTLAAQSLGYYFLTPPRPDLRMTEFDFDRDTAATAETAAINDAVGTMMSSFADRGARMIVFHGNADPVFSANDITAYWDRLATENGGAEATGRFARLFMVPGMNHCGGGPAFENFDAIAAIEGWVERGEAPSHILARGPAFPGRSRPLCPYPQVARYVGGNESEAASFECRAE
ncbi:tannase/feruloyl esterase family alpha/beta hydrolase [Falsiroseomonas sp. HW251]|uniref:tannase/feruloyl esterase family alpha/beta hydrolase n=1 Tax=Falsiroseomonas sp. HW251 TaxID=3390998 RepID=UPI003D32082C